MTPLVFFSSTREDLEEYRAAVLRSVLGLDLLYRGMEFFGSRPQTPREAMLQEVARSDLYVGIIGLRYGSIDRETKWSYTELEYREACKQDIPRMIFLMDERHPVQEGSRDVSGETRRKLKAFRDSLREEYALQIFTTPDDLAAKVAQSLRQWIASKEPEWQRMMHRPLSELEHEYIRKLHSQKVKDVNDAVQRLGASNNPIAHEHFYARLYRGDLGANDFDRVFGNAIHWRDDRRFTQLLFGIAADIPERRKECIFWLAHRGLLDDKQIAEEDVDFVLKYESDTDPAVREEVAHALWKLYRKTTPKTQEAITAALDRLLNDDSEQVRAKTARVLQRMDRSPHETSHRE